jgi:hypothetical protein
MAPVQGPCNGCGQTRSLTSGKCIKCLELDLESARQIARQEEDELTIASQRDEIENLKRQLAAEGEAKASLKSQLTAQQDEVKNLKRQLASTQGVPSKRRAASPNHSEAGRPVARPRLSEIDNEAQLSRGLELQEPEYTPAQATIDSRQQPLVQSKQAPAGLVSSNRGPSTISRRSHSNTKAYAAEDEAGNYSPTLFQTTQQYDLEHRHDDNKSQRQESVQDVARQRMLDAYRDTSSTNYTIKHRSEPKTGDQQRSRHRRVHDSRSNQTAVPSGLQENAPRRQRDVYIPPPRRSSQIAERMDHPIQDEQSQQESDLPSWCLVHHSHARFQVLQNIQSRA